MGKIKFTDDALKALIAKRPAKGQQAFTDSEQQGFRIKISNTAATFSVQGRDKLSGEVRTETIGSYWPQRDWTISDARRTAGEWLPLIKAGKHPRREARAAVQAEKKIAGARKPMSELAPLYVHFFRHEKPAKKGSKKLGRRSWEAEQQKLGVVCGDMGWADLYPEDITEDVAMQLLKDLRDVRGINPNRIHSTMVQFFQWLRQPGAVAKDFVRPAINPFIVLNRIGEEKDRDHVLSPTDIVYLWRALTTNSGFGNEPRSRNTKRVLMLLLLTAQRLSQITGLRRDECQIAPDGSHCFVWSAERMKAGKPFVLPMSPMVRTIIEQAKRETNGDLLFPSLDPRCRGKEMSRCAAWQFLNNTAKNSDGAMEHSSVHDLRATGATMLYEEDDGEGGHKHEPFEISTIMSHAQHMDKRTPEVSFRYFRKRKHTVHISAFRGYAVKVKLVNALERLVLAEAYPDGRVRQLRAA